MKTSPTPVVSDSDVLIHLSNLRRMDLLQILFSSVTIPEYVKAEKNVFTCLVNRF